MDIKQLLDMIASIRSEDDYGEACGCITLAYLTGRITYSTSAALAEVAKEINVSNLIK